MDNPGEILRLCRLCLVKDQVNIPIFEEQGDIRQIFLKISSCLPVKVSRDDQLPKKICDGCLNKLDLLYEFWNTSVNAEKTLLSWLGQAGVKDADEKISAVAQQIAKSAETQVKQEALEDGHAPEVQSFEEEAKDESEAPPPKRARRTAAVKAQINITPESDDDDDMDSAEAMTKVEDETDESDGEDKDPSYGEVPGTSADDQAGPSGVGKDGVEAPPGNQVAEDVIVLSDDDTDDIYLRSRKNSGEHSSDSDSDIIEVNDENENKTSNKSDEEADIDEKNYKGKKLVKQLYCNKCGVLFDDFVELHRHVFSKNHVFSCEKCNKKVGHTICQLREHVIDFHDKCDPNEDSRTPQSPNISEKSNKNLSDVNPGLNRKSSMSDDVLPSTTIGANENNPKYYCERCGQGFNILDKLMDHYKNHTNELLCCPLCSIRSASFGGIMAHFKSHTIINNIELVCKTCDLHFYAIHPYRMHCILVHSLFINIPYTCILCSQILKNHKEFLWHVQSHTRIIHKNNVNTHRPNKNVTYVTCEICAQIFDSSDSCKEHKNLYHDITALKQTVYTCGVCSKSLSLMEMVNHVSQHKDSEEPVLTENAEKDKSLPEGTLLQKKKIYNHKVKCLICKESVLLAKLEEHKESHKFKCKICPRSFNTQQGLNQHILGHNNAEKNDPGGKQDDNELWLPINQHTCNDCGRNFPSLYTLREHSKIHGELKSSSSFQQNFTAQTSQNMFLMDQSSNYNTKDLHMSNDELTYEGSEQIYRSSIMFMNRNYREHTSSGFSFTPPSLFQSSRPIIDNEFINYRSQPDSDMRSALSPSTEYSRDQNMVRNPFSGNSGAINPVNRSK